MPYFPATTTVSTGTSSITDSLKISVNAPETNAAQSETNIFNIKSSFPDTNTLPTETSKLSFTLPDITPSATDGKSTIIRYWLSGSIQTTATVTNPANANGGNDGISSSQQSPAGGTGFSRMTSDVGANIPNGITYSTAIYRGWYVATLTVPTSEYWLILHSRTGLFADINMITETVSATHSTGNYTYDLINTGGINTLAKLQSCQIIHQTFDTASGVSAAVLTVDAGCIELTGII